MNLHAQKQKSPCQWPVHVEKGVFFLLLSVLVMLCLTTNCFAEAAATNYLSGMKGDVSATFGKNSDLPGYLYAAETLVAGFTWMKTKSPWVFIGLPLLMIFTHWGLSYVS